MVDVVVGNVVKLVTRNPRIVTRLGIVTIRVTTIHNILKIGL